MTMLSCWAEISTSAPKRLRGQKVILAGPTGKSSPTGREVISIIPLEANLDSFHKKGFMGLPLEVWLDFPTEFLNPLTVQAASLLGKKFPITS